MNQRIINSRFTVNKALLKIIAVSSEQRCDCKLVCSYNAVPERQNLGKPKGIAKSLLSNMDTDMNEKFVLRFYDTERQLKVIENKKPFMGRRISDRNEQEKDD